MPHVNSMRLSGPYDPVTRQDFIRRRCSRKYWLVVKLYGDDGHWIARRGAKLHLRIWHIALLIPSDPKNCSGGRSQAINRQRKLKGKKLIHQTRQDRLTPSVQNYFSQINILIAAPGSTNA